jgi:dihydrofolate reductase
MNVARKCVASRTITPTWNNAHRLGEDFVASVRQLWTADGLDITVPGSGSVATQLSETGLVDEYQFVILPIALGSGRAVCSKVRSLRLLQIHAFRNSSIVATYPP